MSLLKRILDIERAAISALDKAAMLSTTLDSIEHRLEKITMSTKTIAELLAEVDTVTTGVANRIQALLDQISNDPSATELQAAKDGLQAEIDRLTAMGTAGEVNPNP